MSENNRKNKLISDKNNTYFTENRIMRGNSIPTEGTYLTGDIIINNGPNATDEPMWICNEGGTPGKWGMVANTSTTIVPSYAAMMASKAQVGSIFYVIEDEADDSNPGFFIVTSVYENEEGVKVPSTVDKINKKDTSIPSLTYDPSQPEGTRMYLKNDEDVILKFNFSSKTYGDGKYRVYRDGTLIRSWSAAKGSVIVNLGPIATDGSYNITVTATDYLTIPAPETLSYKVIVGGLKLNSTFDQTLLTAIYEEGDHIEFPYTATVADANANMKLKLVIKDAEGKIVVDEIEDLNGINVVGIWNSPALQNRGLYTLEAQAFTGESIEDTSEGAFTSNKLTYAFRVLRIGEIALIDETKSSQFDNNMFVSVAFRVVSNVAKYFTVKGVLEKKTESGAWEVIPQQSGNSISSAVSITNYWSIGKLEIGEYKYTVSAYTVDGDIKSEDDVVGYLNIVETAYQRVPYVETSLIAYFDANTKRNNDGAPNIWHNLAKTGDQFRILLHDLNYSSNGWKHVDEHLNDDDDGEMMLKFTGESYGEMVEMVNGVPTPYSPFSIFKLGGQQGFALETAIRTRNVGELKARVLTCMKGDGIDTPGCVISYDTMAISSNLQTNKLEFVEDEWVHITLVVDRNIRSEEMGNIGQDNIEDLNKTASLRIYINGVLCSCTVLEDEEVESFLDGSKQTHPLVLNACRMINAAGEVNFENFGECEIKFIRIYNTFLKSSDVLQNYISHIYDREEQEAKKNKNDVNITALPTVKFLRKDIPGNVSFARLNSIKDKKESKKTFVDCVVEYDDGEGTKVVYNNVEVYLQGTSSLVYPVKNYKIKAYEDESKSKKYKFVPPGKENDWIPDSAYTLKCDYMEQSHKNNTPTAKFYETVIDALGGESPAKKDGYHDAIDGIPCVVYYNEGGTNGQDVLVGSFMFNLDKSAKELGFECDLFDSSGNVIGNGKTCCLSYEATANSMDTAGCFYKLSESIKNVYKYYVEDSYDEYVETYGLDTNKYKIEQFQEEINNGTITSYMTFDVFVNEYDEIDYVMDDFECRYSFNEDDNEVSYRPMVNLVNWISESTANGTFKKDFDKHLDLTYTMAYYLQMQMFTQVDNCGKNSMWDTWDGVKFYPRPYDMDTQMGLSNTGTEIIRVDAEILPDMSPTAASGNFAGFEHSDTETDLRYMSYNTTTSKLWNAFAKEFKEEIRSAYIDLRNRGVYTYENITSFIWGITEDVIGEVYMNKDSASKYLSQVNSLSEATYLKMLHGSRSQKYKKFLKERIIFLDTIFGYTESNLQPNTLNSEISLRSDAAYGQGEGATIKCYLGVSVYSPQYVTINVGSGADGSVTAYVGPESRYIDPKTKMEHEGVLFSFPIQGINKEFRVTGAGNIKNLNKLQELNLTEAVIEKATKILSLDFSYSDRMEALVVGNNKYLRSLNCNRAKRLGLATESQSLNLSNCKNLKELDLSYTKFTGVVFPQDTVLNSIVLTGSTVQNVSIDGAEFLHEININNCEKIDKFELNRCNSITDVDVSNSTIQNFVVTNCNNVKQVNLSNCKSIAGFDVTNSYNIEKLNMTGNTSPIMSDLKLYSMYSLKELIVSQTTTAHTIRLPKYLNEEEAFKAVNGESAILWNKLEKLDLSSSSIVKLQYGSADTDSDIVDMTQLDQLSLVKFSNCTDIKEIKNLQYTGNLASLFTVCKNLQKISGILTSTGTSINSMFSQCYLLSDINGLTLNLVGIKSADSTCDRCYRMKTPMLKKILDACGGTLESIVSICHMSSLDGYTGILGTELDTTRTIPSNLFAKNTALKSVNNAFDITGYTTVPSDLFNPCASTLQSAQYTFSRMRSLKTVGSGLFKNKPNLTNVSRAFCDSTLVNYIDGDPNIFVGSPNITSTYAMFDDCTGLISGDSGLGQMLYPLTRLENCAYMFYNCTGLNCEIPNGLLSKNVKLKKINGMFQNCTSLPKLPNSLFKENIGQHVELPITDAVAVFGNCTSMEGVVSNWFFIGAEKLTNIGQTAADNATWSNSKYPNRGFFENTKISGYHETFLNVLRSLKNIDGMFRNCTSLTKCNYYHANGIDELVRKNTISKSLFINNISLSSCAGMFEGCSGVDGCVPAELFESCRGTITNVSNMFRNCTTLSGLNLDATGEEEKLTGISSNWFKNAKLLAYVNGFLYGNLNFSGYIPDDLFEGCTSIINTSQMFYNCQAIYGGIPLTLFDSCRSTLTQTAHMFYSCTGITEPLPTGEYTTERGIIAYELTYPSDEKAKQVVSVMEDPFTQITYSDVVSLTPSLATEINASGNYYVKGVEGDVTRVIKFGLLANCLKLTTIEGMFSYCRSMQGGIPHDLLFTEKNSDVFDKLENVKDLFKYCEKINVPYIEEGTGEHYLCSPLLFDKCPNLVDCSGTFGRMNGITSDMQIYPTMFSKQVKVKTVYEMFMGTEIGGGISPLLFANSISTLEDARKMFAFSKINSMSRDFLNNGSVNNKLKYVYGIFFDIPGLEGASPEFWNGKQFIAISYAEKHYEGALYNCSKLSNYSAAQGSHANWVSSQPIYE